MTQATYKTAIEFVFKWEVGGHAEGGYTNDPRDPGGETKYGISKRAYPNEDIKNLTLERALELYRKDYWDVYKTKTPALDLDTLDPDLAIAVFDTGVNCGVGRAYRWTCMALKENAPTDHLLEYRKGHYVKLAEKMPQYFKGWINRLNDLRKLVDIIQLENATP